MIESKVQNINFIDVVVKKYRLLKEAVFSVVVCNVVLPGAHVASLNALWSYPEHISQFSGSSNEHAIAAC